jgi:hypothetical protein
MATIYDIIMSILGLIIAVIAAIEGFARHVMARAGVPGQIQIFVLLALLVSLSWTAFRIFGGVIGILAMAFVILFLLHLFEPDFTMNFHPSHQNP